MAYAQLNNVESLKARTVKKYAGIKHITYISMKPQIKFSKILAVNGSVSYEPVTDVPNVAQT